jgi:hypothetical protein
MLAEKWTKRNWSRLSPDTQAHVYLAHASLEYAALRVILPFESRSLGLEPMTRFPPYMRRILHNLQHDLEITEQMLLICAVGFFKTTLVMLCYALWRIALDPNLSFIMATDSVENAKRYLSTLQKHIEDNEAFRFVFGDLHPGTRSQWKKGVSWSSTRMTVKRDDVKPQPSFAAYGWNSRFAGNRFDIALCDDCVTRDNATTLVQRDSVYDFMLKGVRARLVPDKRKLVVVGSIHHFDDAHSRLRKSGKVKGDWTVFEYAALTEDSIWPPPHPDGSGEYTLEIAGRIDFSDVHSIWPEWWSGVRLYRDWLADKHVFSANRLLNPLDPELATFPPTVVDSCRACGPLPLRPLLPAWNVRDGIPLPGSAMWNTYAMSGIDIASLSYVIAIDPAVGQLGPRKRGRSFCVMQLWGASSGGLRILLDMWRVESAPPQRFNAQFQLWKDSYYVDDNTIVVYEANAMQKYVALDLQDRFGIQVRKRELKGSKVEDIQALREFMDDGRFFIPWADERSRRIMAPFDEELRTFGVSATIDTIAAAVHAHAYLRPRAGVFSPEFTVLDAETPVPNAPQSPPDPDAEYLRTHLTINRRLEGEGVDPMARLKLQVLGKAGILANRGQHHAQPAP